MKQLVVATVNPEILKTFLKTIFLFEDPKEEYELLIYPDQRKLNVEDLESVIKDLKLKVKYRIINLKPVDFLLNFLGTTDKKVISYIRNQTHHFKITVMLDLWKRGITEFLFLDDDTIILKDLSKLFETNTLYGFLLRNHLYYVHRNSPENMREFENFLDIVQIGNWETIFSYTEKFIKMGQYNAGHFKMILTEDFIEAVKRFYLNDYLKERFFYTAWDFEKDQPLENVSFYNKSFFDEQKFLTYYFYKNQDRVTTEYLNRDSSVYMSYKEDEFLTLDYTALKKKLSKNLIIHYVGKEKIPRANYFFNLKKPNLLF